MDNNKIKLNLYSESKNGELLVSQQKKNLIAAQIFF